MPISVLTLTQSQGKFFDQDGPCPISVESNQLTKVKRVAFLYKYLIYHLNIQPSPISMHNIQNKLFKMLGQGLL